MPYTYQPYYRSRKERGLKQRMFLLEVHKYDTSELGWCFIVKGTTSDYTLAVNNKEIKCSCPDFETRGRICKHLYFIMGRIAKCDSIISTLESDIENGSRGSLLSEDEYTTLSDCLMGRLIERLQPQKVIEEEKQEPPKEHFDGDCSICYEELDCGDVLKCKEGVSPHCHGYFHTDCIKSWLQRNSTCPLCRRKWNHKFAQPEDPIFDPLDKVQIHFNSNVTPNTTTPITTTPITTTPNTNPFAVDISEIFDEMDEPF